MLVIDNNHHNDNNDTNKHSSSNNNNAEYIGSSDKSENMFSKKVAKPKKEHTYNILYIYTIYV